MKNKSKWYSILLIGLVLLLANSVVTCAPNPRYIYENGAIAVGGGGEPIELVNNPNATNPTYAELVAFVKADATDTKAYVEESYRVGGFEGKAHVCADFAEDVHNNAEAAGIRAAWVSIDFEGEDEGHALNAFETTDRGLVYIDCTGDNPGVFSREWTMIGLARLAGHAPPSKPTSWDAVAYVEVGKEYGLIDIAKAKSPSYSFYEQYKQKWQEYEIKLETYNREVERYNQEILGKVYIIGSLEDIRISAWEARLEKESQALDKLAEELGDFWFESLGIVKDIQIHWGTNG